MSKILNVVLTIIVIALIGYIVYDKFLDKDYIKNEDGSGLTSTKSRPADENDNVEYYYYTELIDFEDSNEDDSFTVHKTIYLFENGDYYYDYAEYGDTCGVWSIGKYEKTSGTLTLKETMNGGCDACYYTKNLKTYIFAVKENSLISDGNEVLKKSKADVLPIIDIQNLAGYKNCNSQLK